MARLSKPVYFTNLFSDLEKAELLSITKKGTHKSRKILRAQVLLMISNGKSREEIKQL